MPIDQDNDNWTQPYKKMAAVEETHEANYLLRFYSECFEKKYKTKPLFGSNYSHVDDLKFIARLSQGRAKEIIEQYFKISDNKWFNQHGHSIEILRKNIQVVNATLGKVMAHKINHDIEIEPWFKCNRCGKSFLFRMKVTELSYPEKCKECADEC